MPFVVEQPTGTVTLMFSDIEGSTRLLDGLGAEAYAHVLARHRALMRDAFERHEGYEVDEEGDAFFVAFGRPQDAVAAAADAQRALGSEPWPEGAAVKVRMGVHTGQPHSVPPKYVGMDVHRTARIMAAGSGGQVLISGATKGLLGSTDLVDLGRHRLKDLLEPIELYQLVIDGEAPQFPPLKSLGRTNLPVAPWPLLGRDDELAAIRRMVTDEARLITLTGPGGTGKTRLALQAAAELSDAFPGGAFFVPLASLRDHAGILPAVAVAVGMRADDEVVGWLTSTRALLVLDNLEQLPDAADVVALLVGGRTVVLATSRSPLRLSAERELPVMPLGEESATELFLSRAAAVGRSLEADETVATVCRRLDNLPLAIELAAAMTRLLPPAALLERLESSLGLLTGGARDLPERQRTLRATIAWSHDLLDEPGRIAFRRLSVFRGSFALDDAEAVTGATLADIGALVDQSLVVALPSGRCMVLETLREYARERLDDAAETETYALRHARHYLATLDSNDALLSTARASEVLAWFRREASNLRTMFDRLSTLAPPEAARAAFLLSPYWRRAGTVTEARDRLTELLKSDLPEASRLLVLSRLPSLDERLGNLAAGEEAAREAAALAERLGDRAVLVDALGWVALLAARRGDVAEAEAIVRREAAVAANMSGETRLHGLSDLGDVLGMVGKIEEARLALTEAIAEARSMGHVVAECYNLFNLGILELHEGNFAAARSQLDTSLRLGRQLDDSGITAWAGLGVGYAALGLGRIAEARDAFADVLELSLAPELPIRIDVGLAGCGIAFSAPPDRLEDAARLRGAILAIRQADDSVVDMQINALERRFEEPLIDRAGASAWTEWMGAGTAMSFDEVVALAWSLAAR